MSALTYRLHESVAIIEIDDGRANAYSMALLAELEVALDRAEREAAALLIVGRPGRFSAGYDLAAVTEGLDSARALLGAGGRTLLRVFNFPMPVVAACTGHALAAGAIMLLACDRRIGVGGAFKIGLNEVAIGLALPRYPVELARCRLTPRAFASALLGDVTDPAGAVEAGFLDVVAGGHRDVITVATNEAKRLATLSTATVAQSKRNARGALVKELLDGMDADMLTITTLPTR
jgi:enoyl-CoA hydratase